MRLWLLSLLLTGCTGLPISQMPAKSYNDRVQFLVLHFTAEDFAGSVGDLAKGDYVSSHYLVPESGDPSYPYGTLKIFQLVDENQRAWHAGASDWQGRSNLNDTAIGIEIVNVPQCDPPPYPQGIILRHCDYPPFDKAQIALVTALAQDILKRHPDIGPTQVVGHADIAPLRKDDPGPRFPWHQLYLSGVGAWYDADTQSRFHQLFDQRLPSTLLMQKAFNAYGYALEPSGQLDTLSQAVVTMFQMHFRPSRYDGVWDSDTAACLFALLEKYFPERAEALMAQYRQEPLQTTPSTSKK
ncbi:N-acetylmuramoyl-L-alanine amidase [Gallaecimonas pentaromativorans]|uniref:N-acetylmuramoyl-L-alanine amidase n=2 Tax=Gallaecimonas pentaromativorans TaxID=584787 RepID=A0A3N1PG76_9GAMM|nr:N-acetylmuramoyl-L-alanine amidase [Gallaecimonas pentaromativorans]ROQ30462.1 N-acetylmuramoyl-L-alanine amidase [Gallaecimonas pentaromativorans]